MKTQYRGTTSATQSVFEVIEKNPGISTKEIHQMLSSTFNFNSVHRAVTNLRDNRHEVENRGGGVGHKTEWYVVNRSDPFYELADKLFDEIQGMTPGMKRGYLAELLQEVSLGVKP